VGIESAVPVLKGAADIQNFSFSPGDELLYIGYAGGLQSGFLNVPEADETYIFQFATNIPCPGTPVVEYMGKVYNTIQVFGQCWLKENLDAGTMIPVSQEMTNNGLLEKYCYNDHADSCTKYGGLYQWDEMMQYVNQEGARGICPAGWHVPTDEEWKVLEGAVDSQYKIGDPMWDLTSEERGFDAGTNLRTTSGWYEGGNGTDLFGFSCLPGGNRHNLGFYSLIGEYGYFRTSTESGTFVAWRRNMAAGYSVIERYDGNKMMGHSVRCIKDQ
jgi:uncharacterized protein (TIGR02145 family)